MANNVGEHLLRGMFYSVRDRYNEAVLTIRTLKFIIRIYDSGMHQAIKAIDGVLDCSREEEVEALTELAKAKNVLYFLLSTNSIPESR